MATVPITNPGGETGDLTGWTVVSGTWTAPAADTGINPHSGSRFLFGEGGSGSTIELQQDCAVDPGDEADIDAGRALLSLSAWMATAGALNDAPRVQLEFLDGVGTSIYGYPNVSSPYVSPGTAWAEHSATYRVPPGCRTIRFSLIGRHTSGGGQDVAFDDLSMSISQDAARVEGDFPLSLQLLNPNADFATGNDNTQAALLVWNTVSGSRRSVSDYNTAISGSYVFSATGSAAPECEQLVDLFAEQLEAFDGRIVLKLQAFVSTIGADFGLMGIRFYDEDLIELDDVADTRFDTAADMADNTWSQAVMFAEVPWGARFAEVYLHCDNNGGTNSAFCWDDVELQAYIIDDFVSLGQFHTSFNATTVSTGADEKHGAVHTVGLNGMDVFRLGFFADVAAAANVRGVIYAVDGSNNPTDLIAESDEITAVVRGWNEVRFSSPPTLTAGSSYWIGFHTDAAITYRPGRHGAVPAASSSGADAFADGAADPFGSPSALGNAVPVYVLAQQAAGGAVGDSGKRSIVIAITC